jgi:protein-tyrosine phosphatase
MAQLLLSARIRERSGIAANRFEVSSAGTYDGFAGASLDPAASRALVALGLDPTGFVARALEEAQVVGSDLILGASREHRAAVVTLVPQVSRRAFTLREFARLATYVAGAGLEAADPVERARGLVATAAAQRAAMRAARPADDDVADPYRRPEVEFQRAAATIDAAVTAIAAALLPDPP